MSDTPRTDAQKRGDFVHINFARELERENTALRADKERLEWLEDAPIERLVRITHLLITNDLDICRVRDAIDAARRRRSRESDA